MTMACCRARAPAAGGPRGVGGRLGAVVAGQGRTGCLAGWGATDRTIPGRVAAYRSVRRAGRDGRPGGQCCAAGSA